MIILDSNSQICFDNSMITVNVIKTNCARGYAFAVV
jgi:hypothetical protein